MRPNVYVLLIAAMLLSCAGVRGKPAGEAAELVGRALAAQGGADAVAKLRTIVVNGSATFWEPEQSVVPGGEPRLAAQSRFAVARDLAARTARIEWVKKLSYPAPREYQYIEIVTPSAGRVVGIDSAARTKQSQDADPPQHAMSGVRLATALRELERTSPRLLLDLRAKPGAISRAPDESAGGAAFPTVKYQSGDVEFLLLFDGATGLPSRIRTHDADNVWGDSTYDLVLDGWRDVGGLKLPLQQRYELNGKEIVRVQLDDVQVNPASVGPDAFEIPAALRATAARPASGPVPYQWVLRRQHIGVYLDSDAVHFDPQASQGLKLVDVAPGVSQVVGGTHNSLVVELADELVVFDAPIDDRQSRFTIDSAKARYGGKPIRTLVLSHHHMDHIGGARAFLVDGATVVVGQGAGAHLARALAAPARGSALAKAGRKVEIVEVADRATLGDGARRVEVFRVENPHCEGMLIGYVPDAKLGFVTDLWSPGRDKLGGTVNPGQAALVAAVKKAGITPERFAGGHGSVAEYAPLAALAAR
jgi:glyoxylase-like metal-dependent hydrolase (beta-lactamase superfamily II)